MKALDPLVSFSPCAVSSWYSSDRHGKPSFSSACFIPVTSCISSIYLLLDRLLRLLPSLRASIISFSNPFDCITCPKNPSFLIITICCSVSSSYSPISNLTLSLVFFSVHDILCIFLYIHPSHALIFFPFSLLT